MTQPIEIAFARLDERFQSFEKAFGQMVEDQRSLTISYQKLVESNQRISVLENDAITLEKSLDTLWAKFDAHVASHNKFTGNLFFEILKLALAVVIGGIAGHYGIRLPI
ncbi:MAG TPA: hypothetical protein VNW52_10590 [Burkholderiaceae bacterium]|jgi:hypothetical protein|nr:hypothetical protein [Burkholderiaceae bacterium]